MLAFWMDDDDDSGHGLQPPIQTGKFSPIHRLSLTSSSAAVSVTGGDLEPSGRCCATSLERKDSLWETGSLCLEWLNVPGLCCVLMQAE